MVDEYEKEKREKELLLQQKTQKQREYSKQDNIEKSKAIFVVRTLEPHRGVNKTV